MEKDEIKKLIYIRYNINGDVYKTIEYAKTLYPEKPKAPAKPVLNSPHTAQEALEYSSKLKQYESEYQVYDENKTNRMADVNIITDALLEFIKYEAGLYTIPKQYQDKVSNYAWEEGHSDGYYEVYLKLCNLVEIFH